MPLNIPRGFIIDNDKLIVKSVWKSKEPCFRQRVHRENYKMMIHKLDFIKNKKFFALKENLDNEKISHRLRENTDKSNICYRTCIQKFKELTRLNNKKISNSTLFFYSLLLITMY